MSLIREICPHLLQVATRAESVRKLYLCYTDTEAKYHHQGRLGHTQIVVVSPEPSRQSLYKYRFPSLLKMQMTQRCDDFPVGIWLLRTLWRVAGDITPRKWANQTCDEDQIWSCRQVAGLLEMLPWIDREAARKSLRRGLLVYLEQITASNILALAEYIRCPPSIPRNWLDGVTVPQLENLLRTSRCLNVPASSFFTPSGPTPANIAAAREAIAVASLYEGFAIKGMKWCKLLLQT